MQLRDWHRCGTSAGRGNRRAHETGLGTPRRFCSPEGSHGRWRPPGTSAPDAVRRAVPAVPRALPSRQSGCTGGTAGSADRYRPAATRPAVAGGQPTGGSRAGVAARGLSGRPINGGRVGPLGSHRPNAPGSALVPGGPARRWQRARRHLRLTAGGGRRPRTARRPGAHSRRPAAPRRPGRRRARAATEPPPPAGTARPPCTCRTPGSPALPALRRPRPSGPAPALPRPAPSRAPPPAWCARRTDAAAGRVAASRRTRRQDLSCHACG